MLSSVKEKEQVAVMDSDNEHWVPAGLSENISLWWMAYFK
jgi:hypothetical protein